MLYFAWNATEHRGDLISYYGHYVFAEVSKQLAYLKPVLPSRKEVPCLLFCFDRLY